MGDTGEGKPQMLKLDPFHISRLLADEYAVKILAATKDKAESIYTLSERFDIPLSACYRRVGELEALGLLVFDGKKLSEKGKRAATYRSKIKNAVVTFKRGDYHVKLELWDPTTKDSSVWEMKCSLMGNNSSNGNDTNSD